MPILGAEVWKEIQNNIVNKIGAQRFNLWLKNSTLKSLEADTAVIGVPNPFILTWIEDKLAADVEEALCEHFQKKITARFTVDGTLFRQMRKLQQEQQDEAITFKSPSGATYAENEPLNQRYNFERYAVGEGNRFAYEMSRRIIETRGEQFSTLLVYGGSGLGKTHLLQACAKELKRRYPEITVRYVSCEQFVNQFVTAIKSGKVDSFRRRHRNADALIIDDIHWLAGKKASQEEFLHTFNALSDKNRIIIAASDEHPSQTEKISRALLDRFSAAMTARIDPPDRDTKIAIINQRAAEMKRSLPRPVVEYIADVCEGNIRELEGAVMKLLAFNALHKSALTLALARTVLQEDLRRRRERVSLEKVLEAVCEVFGISAADLKSSRRTRSIAFPRQVAMYLARKLTTASLKEVGQYFGNKSHATALHSETKIRAIVENDQPTADIILRTEARILRRGRA